MIDLEELRKLAESATPGPWWKGSWRGQCHMDHPHGRGRCRYEYSRYDSACVSTKEEGHELIGYDDWGTVLNDENAAFIAAANPATVLALLDVVEAAKDAMAQIRDQRTVWPAEVDTLGDALARLDGKEQG